jgi:hypothetical protein
MPAVPPLRISAKNLGGLALPEFCPRCFWLGLHYKLPFKGPFPGIFTSLDSYTKNVVHAYFDRFQSAPSWLSPLGEFKSYIPPPNWRTFFVDDSETRIHLTGTPDAIFVRSDGSKAIIDYKTARHTEHQDELFPMYDVQLNGYAMIADQLGMGPVRDIALVYTEPVTDGNPAFLDGARTDRGFRMDFHAKVVRVKLAPAARIPPLLRTARRIYDAEEPPEGRERCKDCMNFDALLSASRAWK